MSGFEKEREAGKGIRALLKRPYSVRKAVGAAVMVLALQLLIAAVMGYSVRGTESVTADLKELRSAAVVHVASEGLVDMMVREAQAARRKDLRDNGYEGRKFREMGSNEVDAIIAEAGDEARGKAVILYGSPNVPAEARPALDAAIQELETRLAAYGELRSAERKTFSGLYVSLVDSVPSWSELTAAAGEDDEALFAALCKVEPGLAKAENAQFRGGFLTLARDMAQKEADRRESEMKTQLLAEIDGAISEWAELQEETDDGLWEILCREIPELADNDRYRADAIARVRSNIETVLAGKEVAVADSSATEGNTPVSETQADYRYFTASDELKRLEKEKDDAHSALWDRLTDIVPSLKEIKSKDRDGIMENVDKVLYPGDLSFTSRYQSYTADVGEQDIGTLTWFAGGAENILLLGLALLLLGAMLFWWDTLTPRFGVPRIIIMLFFLYLILAAQFFNISIPLMMGNVLERMVMYGILALAMMPGIQCGIGLNMGMTIGCIAGLLGVVLSLQFDMTGAGGLFFAVMSGVLIAVPLGWAYSILLNRMKGNEMTISTYVGFSFVSLMCIGWMLLPFTNPKIIWLLSGQGLRVTHSLLGSYGHLLDKMLSFEIFGMKIPTGGLLFMGLCCLLMWLFSRTRVGIAMTAAGSNPRFAEASGINVNRMRSLGTILSTVFAAVGIVIYSQSFGYAQLYTAPRQLGFIAASAILIGGASVRKARVGHVLLGVFLFEGVLVFGQQIANSAVAGGGLSEVMRIMISNGIILYALTQTGGGRHE